MIKFVNAKINLGLNIIRKRDDGYHDIETVFYPIGIYNGLSKNPTSFGDILEIHLNEKSHSDEFTFSGNLIECKLEDNLVYKSLRLFRDSLKEIGKNSLAKNSFRIFLDKHIPDKAGLGGGSADASFVLKMLNEISGEPFNEDKLISMAAKIGADCPFFIPNVPVLASGIGDLFQPISINLKDFWAVIIKPDVSISTKEAFANIIPTHNSVSIPSVLRQPVEKWEELGLSNAFETPFFKKYPNLKRIKTQLRDKGALYASLSGSGSSIYGLFRDPSLAKIASESFGFQSFLIRL